MAAPSALSAFAAVGLAIALAYLLASTVWSGIAQLVTSRRAARSGLHHQPAAFVALEIDSIDRRLQRHCTAVLIFGICFGVLALFARHDHWPDQPTWGWVMIGSFVALIGAFAVAKGLQLVWYRGHLRSLLDAGLGVAQRLDEVKLRGHRVFHAVPVGDGVVDHVVVGPLGVFAILVVLPSRPGASTVSLTRGCLVFGPEHGFSGLQPVVKVFAGLARELGRSLGRPLKIVPMLVVPGCRVESSDEKRFLLSNEQNCITLVGWKDPEAYLMDDEIAGVSQWLSARCQPPQQPAWGLPKRPLQAFLVRPRFL